MGKYSELLADVFTIFAAPAWVGENIKTYPENFLIVSPGDEFIRVSVIPSGPGINPKSVSGVLQIDLFSSAGSGPKRLLEIADKLDTYLQQKTVSGRPRASLQCFTSSFASRGRDPDNTGLYRGLYTIPFSYFGAT